MSAIDEVRERTDVLELIGRDTQLRKAGRLYKGLCPFHEEREPSFVVYPDSGRWQCFGACAASGDVFEYVKRRDGLSFPEALATLAARAGVQLEAPSPEAEARKARRDRLRAALAHAAEFYHRSLLRAPGAEAARAYLRSRRFDREAALAFGLGWSPGGRSATGDALRAAGFSNDELVAAGLLYAREGGGVVDNFRDRLMFPIRDAQGRPVGFGARALRPEEQPKYKNSPQSELFDKSSLLYGLDRARPAIRAAQRAVLVEGYTDVVRAHMAGFANVVASLGTALNESHVRTLRRHAADIVLALDADAAGQAATVRALDVAAAADATVAPVPTARGWVRYESVADAALYVATLPPGLDPDDVIRDDPGLWEALIRDAQPIMAFLFAALTRDLDLSRPQDKARAVDRLAPYLAGMGDPVARAAWRAELAQLTGIDERSIAARDGRRAQSGSRHGLGHRTDGPEGAPERMGRRDAASWLLGQLLLEPRRLAVVNACLRGCGQPDLSAEDWSDGVERSLFQGVRHAALGAPPPDAPSEQRLDRLPPELATHAGWLRERVAQEPALDGGHEASALETAALRMREARTRQTLAGMRAVLGDGPPEEHAALQARRQRLTADLSALNRRLYSPIARDYGRTDAAVG